MLSDIEILKEIENNNIRINNFVKTNLRSSSYNLKPGIIYGAEVLSDSKKKLIGWRIPSGQTVVVVSSEKLSLNGMISGMAHQSESLMRRKGLSLLNAGLIDPGWGRDENGNPNPTAIVAILKNLQGESVTLDKNDTCFRLTFYKLAKTSETPYWKRKKLGDENDQMETLRGLADNFQNLFENKIQSKLEELDRKIDGKMSLRDLIDMFGFLMLAFSLTIALIAGVIVSTSGIKNVEIGTYIVPSAFPYFAITIAIIALLVWVIVSWHRKLKKKE